MALAEPLFTSQLYRENANVDTYMHLPTLSIAPSLPSTTGSLHPHLTCRPPLPSARNFVHKLFYGEIPPDRARLHFSASVFAQFDRQLRFRASHLALLKFARTLVRSSNIDFVKITGEIAYVTSHIEVRKRIVYAVYFNGRTLTEIR